MKNLLISAGIFSIGIGVGVLASKTYFDKKYREMAEEEIASVKEFYDRRSLRGVPEIIEETVKESIASEKPPLNGFSTVSISSDVLYSTPTIEAVPYNEHYQTESKVDKAQTLSPEEDEPYEITVEEFTDDDEFDKVTLNYYMEDGMLIYEEGEDVADETIIGSENLDDFASVPLSQAYYRDPKKNIDYEVIKVDGSYQELIAGI